MNKERLTRLLQFLQEDPNDPFNIYCLANEFKNYDTKEAWKYYNDLLINHTQYLPTYYHAAELKIDNGEIAKAEIIITNGIELAIKQNDKLALRELRNMQNNLLEY